MVLFVSLFLPRSVFFLPCMANRDTWAFKMHENIHQVKHKGIILQLDFYFLICCVFFFSNWNVTNVWWWWWWFICNWPILHECNQCNDVDYSIYWLNVNFSQKSDYCCQFCDRALTTKIIIMKMYQHENQMQTTNKNNNNNCKKCTKKTTLIHPPHPPHPHTSTNTHTYICKVYEQV